MTNTKLDRQHRPRVGLIVPSSNTVVERDFAEYLGDEASIHASRMFLEETTEAAEREMIDRYLPQAVTDIGSLKPSVVAFACTSAGAVLGRAGETHLLDEIAAATSAVAVSTNQAVKEVIGSHHPEAVAVLTPYVAGLTDRIRSGLESDGINVVRAVGLGIVENFAIARLSISEIVSFAVRELRGSSFDLLFISCTNLSATGARGLLSDRLGVPVVTSNQATIECVRAALNRESVDEQAHSDG